MSRARLVVLFAVCGLLAATHTHAAPPTPQEKKRKELMKQLGIDAKEAPPKDEPGDRPDADPPTAPPEKTPPATSPPAHPPDSPDTEGPSEKPTITYVGRIHGLLRAKCGGCHVSGGKNGYEISGETRADHRRALALIDLKTPARSRLLKKAAGDAHGGGTVFRRGSGSYQTLIRWIEQGAPYSASSTPSSAPPAARPPSSASPTPSPSQPPTAAAPTTAKNAGRRPRPVDPAPAQPTASPESAPPFTPEVHAILTEACEGCHEPAQAAGRGGFVLTGDASADYDSIRAWIDLDAPPRSKLLEKGAGRAHAGGTRLPPGNMEYATVLAWIEGGAGGPAPASDPSSESATTANEPPADAVSGASPAATGSRLGDGTPLGERPNRLPVALPFHLRINGKLDLSYERRDFKGHPFQDTGRNAVQTYHHFVFLSRSGADDPFGFDIELITRQFYEFNARVAPSGRRFGFLFKAGKILVPFGSEPVFHHSYGGRSGFDQRILPVVWALPGVAVRSYVRAGPVTLSDDLYSVQGYGLGDQDEVLDLQSDISPRDDVKLAVGNRVGASWNPVSAWYSFQVNPLGFGRLLFMQALDVEFWRVRDIPVLEDLVVGVGGLRADVSGGGPGLDYYHFGSYAMLRYYPAEFLYLQYRAGLQTHDNRRGSHFDTARADERDGSSHNVTVGGRYKGFYAALQLFLNLEKANELDDDYLRVTVGYEF